MRKTLALISLILVAWPSLAVASSDAVAMLFARSADMKVREELKEEGIDQYREKLLVRYQETEDVLVRLAENGEEVGLYLEEIERLRQETLTAEALPVMRDLQAQFEELQDNLAEAIPAYQLALEKQDFLDNTAELEELIGAMIAAGQTGEEDMMRLEEIRTLALEAEDFETLDEARRQYTGLENEVNQRFEDLPPEEKMAVMQHLKDRPAPEKYIPEEIMAPETELPRENEEMPVVKEENTEPDQRQPMIVNKPFYADETPWYQDWEAWGVILALIGGLAALISYFLTHRKGKLTTKYFRNIDDIYSTYRMKGYRCEAELYRLKDMISDDFKEGRMNESSFQLLDSRVDKYLTEVRESIVNEKFGGIPASLKDSLKKMLESGEISETEYEKFKSMIQESTLSAEEKTDLDKLVKDWQEQDKNA